MSKKKSRIKKMLWLCRVTDEPLVRSQLFSAAPVWPKKKITYDRFKVSQV